MAYVVVHELKSRLKVGNMPVFSTDGLKHYFYALTAHFGEWVKFRAKKARVDDPVGFLLCTGHQPAKKASHCGGGTPAYLGSPRGLKGTLEFRRYEWEHQHRICGKGQPDHPTKCLKTNSADLEKSTIQKADAVSFVPFFFFWLSSVSNKIRARVCVRADDSPLWISVSSSRRSSFDR
jgi:hypothetical protein